jgi:hypothetical protein
MSLHPDDATQSLDALLLSARPLRRLTVLSFDFESPIALIAEISTRFPMLEALHAVVLRRQSTYASCPRVFFEGGLLKFLSPHN